MSKFLELEGGYLAIGLFVMLVALYVTTRPFVGGGQAWKRALPLVFAAVMGFISVHYFSTTSRMSDVKKRFLNGKAVICESRAVRKVAQSVIIDPKSIQNWILVGDVFESHEYTRGFHSARCLEYTYPNQQNKQTVPKPTPNTKVVK